MVNIELNTTKLKNSIKFVLVNINIFSHFEGINILNSIAPTYINPALKKQTSDTAIVHKTGCARTEGYYKIEHKQKVS